MKRYMVFAIILHTFFVSAFAAETAVPSSDYKLKPAFKELWCVDLGGLSPAEQTMAATLQGLVRDGEKRIWIMQGAMNNIVLGQLKTSGVKVNNASSVWQLLELFKGRVKGAVVYKSDTESVNIATSLCGVLDAVAVEQGIVEKAKEAGLVVLKDATKYTQQQVLDEFGAKFTKSMLIQQAYGKFLHLRDLAVARRVFTCGGPDEKLNKSISEKVASGVPVYGWGGDELEWVKYLSRFGNYGIPADWSTNLSVLQDVKVKLPRRPKPANVEPARKGQRIVAFVMSDGDNIQWMAGGFVSAKGFWANQHRGKFNMTWEMAPILSEVAPASIGWLYKTASTGQFVDDFVVGPSGAGYAFHHYLPDRKKFAAATAKLMKKTDMTITTMLNDNAGDMSQSKELLERLEVAGVIYKDYVPYNRRDGKIYWHNNKPCVAYKFLLWEKLGHPKGVAEGIRKMPADPTRDPNSYALINVHAWSFKEIGGPMEAVKQTIDLLPENTRVVTSQEFFTLLKQNSDELQKNAD